jgi:hypothetical protein
MSLAQKGRPKQYGVWNKGKHHTAESKAKISTKAKGRRLSVETRQRISMSNTGKKRSLATKEAISRANKGLQLTDEQHQRFVVAMRKLWANPEYVTKMCAQRQTSDYRSNMSKKLKILFKDPRHRKKVLHRRQMSGPESVFMTICAQYGLEYRFVGNGALWIGGKNPDFIGIKNEHIVIEIWGDYFHRGQDPQDRIDHFKQFGYTCLVVWASELHNICTTVDKVRRLVQ